MDSLSYQTSKQHKLRTHRVDLDMCADPVDCGAVGMAGDLSVSSDSHLQHLTAGVASRA